MLEKGNAAKLIFEEYEIDDSAKELSEKIRWAAGKESKKKTLQTTDVSLLKICKKIGRSPHTIAIWLKCSLKMRFLTTAEARLEKRLLEKRLS